MNIQLNIERLVLDGINLPQHQGPMLKASIEAELTRLLTEGGLSPGMANGLAVPRIATGNLQLNATNNATQLGQQIARSIYGGIGHE